MIKNIFVTGLTLLICIFSHAQKFGIGVNSEKELTLSALVKKRVAVDLWIGHYEYSNDVGYIGIVSRTSFFAHVINRYRWVRKDFYSLSTGVSIPTKFIIDRELDRPPNSHLELEIQLFWDWYPIVLEISPFEDLDRFYIILGARFRYKYIDESTPFMGVRFDF